MILVFIVLNSLIFIFLSGLHIYWAAGGKWAADSAIPVNEEGRKAFEPGIVMTLIVAVGLFLFAIATLGKTGVFNSFVEQDYFNYCLWIISGIFLLRTLGDFKSVGVFKKIKNSEFANMDSKIYSPLTFYLGISSLLLTF